MIGKIGRHSGNQRINAGLPCAQRQARLGQALPILGHQGQHRARAFFGTLPQKVIEPRDMMIALVEHRTKGAAQLPRLGPGHHQACPTADRLGLGGGAIAARLMGQRKRA